MTPNPKDNLREKYPINTFHGRTQDELIEFIESEIALAKQEGRGQGRFEAYNERWMLAYTRYLCSRCDVQKDNTSCAERMTSF